MKRTEWVGLGAALVLSGCAMHPHDRAGHLGDRLHERPIVTVKGGLLSVAPEPMVFSVSDFRKRDATQRVLVWELPAGYRFNPKGGIDFKGVVPAAKAGANQAAVMGSTEARLEPAAEVFRCGPVSDNPRAYRCAVDVEKLQVRRAYRYMIRVLNDRNEAIEWDPHAIPIE